MHFAISPKDALILYGFVTSFLGGFAGAGLTVVVFILKKM